MGRILVVDDEEGIRTFLAEAKARENLEIVTEAVATGLLFDGKRCTGVAYRQGAQDQQVHAARDRVADVPIYIGRWTRPWRSYSRCRARFTEKPTQDHAKW